MKRGNIVARGRGYRITVRYGKDDQTGKYQRYTEQFNGGSKDAAKRLTQILNDIDLGKFAPSSKITVEQYLTTWLDDYCKPNLSTNTYSLYKYLCEKHIIPEIGKLILTDLKPQQLQHLYSVKKESKLSSRTVQLIHITIHKALKNAVKTNQLMRNVAEAVDPPRATRHEFQILSPTDIQLFLEFARDTDYYALFYTYFFTGMRRSEALALRIKDLNLPESLSVNRTMQVVGTEITFKEPKTKNSRRVIPLTPSNAAILQEYIDEMNGIRAKAKNEPMAGDDLLFCHTDGSPIRPDVITHLWMKLRTKCGLKDVRLHDARHTFATIHLELGTYTKVVSEILGHAGTAITQDLYTHKVSALHEAAARSLDSALLPKAKEEATK